MKGVRSDGKEGPSSLLDNFDVGESEKIRERQKRRV
jgi:hypothetical protein